MPVEEIFGLCSSNGYLPTQAQARNTPKRAMAKGVGQPPSNDEGATLKFLIFNFSFLFSFLFFNIFNYFKKKIEKLIIGHVAQFD